MRRFILRLLSVFRPGSADDELAREARAHLALLEDEYRRRSLSADEARLAARRAMGSVALVHDRARDARSFAWVDDLMRDGRHAVRRLRQAPGFAAAAILTLGLGVAVNNTFFTMVNAICLRGLPIDAPERVLTLGTRDARGRPGNMSYAEFEGLRSVQKSFAGVAAYTSGPVTLADEGRAADRVMGAHISAAGFNLLGELPLRGRGFRPEDDRPGAPAVVIIGAGVWNSRYAGDAGIIGRTVVVNGSPANVIGVMAEGVRFLQNTELWQPMGTMAGLSDQRRDLRSLFVFGRLAPQVPAEQAVAEVEALGTVWAREFPASNRDITTRVVPINEALNGDVTDRTWLSFITAGALVLLVACANVANLLLMRGAIRGREIAIRASIGATRGRLVRQLLIESALLASLGALVGVLFSLLGLRALWAFVPEGALQYWMTFTIDARVLAVLVAVSAASVFVFGLAPALHLLRVDVNQIIKDSGRVGAAGLPARRWTTAFLALEFALTLVLLTVVAGGVRQSWIEERAEFALDSAPLLSMWITLPGANYPSPESRAAFHDEVAGQLAAIPGVESVTVGSVLPRVSAPPMQLEIAGREAAGGSALPIVAMVGAGDNYFETLAVSLVRGRAFTRLDGSPGQEAAIVNQRLVDMFFGSSDPIGQLIRVARPGTTASGSWARIVGVSPAIRQRPGGFGSDPVVYFPHRSSPSATAAIIVRATGEPTSLVPAIREELRRLDPNLPLYRVMSLRQAMDESAWNPRMASMVAEQIAVIALLMALVGLYAVTAHAVQLWKTELGLRIALGARPLGVAWIVLRRALAQLAIGLLAGVAATYAFDRLFTVTDPADPVRMTDTGPLLLLMALIAVVAIVACAIPVRRAIHVDPVVALRAE